MTSAQPRRARHPDSRLLYLSTAGLLVVFALLAGVLVGPEFALPIVVLGVLVLAFFAVNDVAARRNLSRHDDDPLAAAADETESIPSALVVPDETALGDTPEAHAEISPVDMPKDSPSYAAVVEQAARSETGTTRGNADGAQGGRELDPDDAPPAADSTDDHEAARRPDTPAVPNRPMR